MATIQFNVALFRAFAPAFADATKYPDALLQMYWNTATAYISNKTGGCYCGGLTLAQQTLALNMLTAHLAQLNALAATGQQSGFVTSATIDKISVQVQAPPEANQWQWWLNQTPYGQQLLALLQSASVGGFYFGAYPVAFALRR